MRKVIAQRGRNGKTTRFSFAGNASRSKYAALQDTRGRLGGSGDYRSGTGDQSGYRKIARASSEHRMSADSKVAPLVIIISGPSGSGKSTLVQRVLDMPGTMPSISCTTRGRRATESSGKCYDFVTDAEFEAMIGRGEFLEYARVFGRHSYGTPKKWLEESRQSGLDLVLEIVGAGGAQGKQQLPESVAIFILPPSRQE